MTGRALLALVALLAAACTSGDEEARPSPTTDATTSTSLVDLSGVVLPPVGGLVNLVVLVAQRTVDADGVVASAPLAGLTVEPSGLGRWILRDGGTTSTSRSGSSSSTTSTSTTAP